MTQVRKIYVDSRWRLEPFASTHSDFVFQLPQSIEVPENYVAIIPEFSCSNVFYTVQFGINSRLFWEEKNPMGAAVYLTAHLASAYYSVTTLAIELQRVLNANTGYAGDPYLVQYDSATGKLKISSSANEWRIWTRSMLRYGVGGSPWGGSGPHALDNVLDTRDVNEVIGMVQGTTQLVTPLGTVFQCLEFPDINFLKALFLTSPDLGLTTSMSAHGGGDNILRRVDVTAPWGNQIISQLGLPFEYIDCEGQQLSSLRFRLVDSAGRLVDTRGRSISFSILLIPRHLV